MRYLLVLFCLTTSAAAQTTTVAKGKLVTLRTPLSAFTYQSDKYTAAIAMRGEMLAVNDSTSWRAASLPLFEMVKVNDIKGDSKTGVVTVRLSPPVPISDIYLTIPQADTAKVFARMFAPPESSKILWQRAVDSTARWVVGDSSGHGLELGRSLSAVGEQRQPWDTVTEAWRGLRYLRVNAPDPKYTYNNNQTSEAQRTAGSLNEVAFPVVKRLGSVAKDSIAGAGFAVVVTVKHKDMAGQYAWLNGTSHDQLIMYVPSALAVRYANADVTNQELVDGSVIMYKGNRIKVDLTK